MSNIALAPRTDTDTLAAQFAETGRLRIPGLLREADATRLHDALARRTPWNLFILHDGPKVMPLAHWQALPAAERKFIDDQMAVAARDKFEARFLQCPLTETGEPFAGLIPELDALARFLNDEPFLSFMRAVTGSAAIAFADAQATCYRANDSLHRHTDEVPGKNRIVAYVLNLTPRWQPEWGGLLNFMAPNGQVDEAWVPSFNTLNLLRVPQNHFVGSVAGFVEAPRLAVTGWLRHR
jgi:SM-20-related protein